MAHFFGGFFKHIEKPQDTHPPSVPQTFSQYDNEYITYCIEQEQTISNLEAQLHTDDDPEKIAKLTLQTACKFYGADWAGVIELDLDLKVWGAGWWHNVNPDVNELQKMQEFENLLFMPSLVEAIKKQKPIIISNIEDVKNYHPSEYQVYKRLEVKSVLAVPYGPNPLGFLVVRNPVRYGERTSALKSFAYVVHRAIAQKNALEKARMALTPAEIQSDTDIIINFFGNMEIITQDGAWNEHDFNSPKCCRTVAYILLQGKSAHSALAIANALYPEDDLDIDSIYKNISVYIYRFRKSFEPICKHSLIDYNTNGYRLNPALNVTTDLQQFERLWKRSQQDIPIPQKVHLLKRAFKLYRGSVFASACDNHWLVSIATDYKMKYVGVVNELLSILAQFKDYDGINHFATKSLALVPENVRAQYWLIHAVYHSGAICLAKKEIQQAKARLTADEFKTLQNYIGKDASLPYGELFE